MTLAKADLRIPPAIAHGLGSQNPRRMLRIASVGVSALMVFAPMFADAAAPEIAMAAARSRSLTRSSTDLVEMYPVPRLPVYLAVNTKKSASRPRWFAYFDPRMLSAALMIWYGPY